MVQSPPQSPSPDQQRDALQKGLGRSMQWAMARQLDDDPHLAACLRDQRFDVQVENSRGDWLWRMIREVDAVGRFRVPILHALYDLSDDRSAVQLCKLARHYAEAGDETFRMRLYDIVEQKPIADGPWLGEREIVRLDGEEAFVFAARVRGKQLASREWEWDDESLVGDAIERFGGGRVGHLLEHTRDRALGRFREGWRRQKEKAGRERQPSHGERRRKITVEALVSAAGSDTTRFGPFRGWGMHAEGADLEMVLQHLWAAREPRVIANLLKVFSNRALPRFDARLIELCRHGDPEVRRLAFHALEMNEHRLIGAFALAELEKGVRDGSVVGLFIRNYRRGDEVRVLESVLEGRLGDRFILFGEWLYARHSIHYRGLSHYFFEFDIYDKEVRGFLSLARRLALLEGTGLHTVPVIHTGPLDRDRLVSLIGPSRFAGEFEDPLTGRTDHLMEGLYLRTEAEGVVTRRAKFVRSEFVEKVKRSEHWQHQAMTANRLEGGADIWS